MEELTRYGPSTAACANGGTPPTAGQRGSGGHRLRGRGTTARLGRGRCGEGGLRGKLERLVRMVVLVGQGCDGEARSREHAGEAFGVELDRGYRRARGWRTWALKTAVRSRPSSGARQSGNNGAGSHRSLDRLHAV
jgi:hypothetical protein